MKTVFLPLCGLLMHVCCGEPAPGIYEEASDIGAKETVKTDSRREVLLGRALSRSEYDAVLTARSTWNDAFEVQIRTRLDFSKSLILIANHTVLAQSGFTTSDKQGAHVFPTVDSDIAKAIEKQFAGRVERFVHPSHKLIIRFVPKEAKYKLGSAAIVACELKNIGDSPILVGVSTEDSRRKRQLDFFQNLSDASQPMATDIRLKSDPADFLFPTELKPGQIVTIHEDLTRFVEFSRAGRYSFVGTCEIRLFDARYNEIWREKYASDFEVDVRQ